jgi:hypothetical protein
MYVQQRRYPTLARQPAESGAFQMRDCQSARLPFGVDRQLAAAKLRLRRSTLVACVSAAAVVWCSPSVLAQPSTASEPPAGIAADWSRGIWRSFSLEEGHKESFYFSGYGQTTNALNGGDYEDPNGKWTNPPPLTPKYLARYNQIRQAAFNGRDIYDQGSNCSPLGLAVMTGFGLMEILFKRGEITMIYEEDGGVRRIFTDGRPHPAPVDLIPTYNGHSIGHWEGKTLVVDTVGLRDDTYIEVGMPHSSQLHIIERWTQVSPDELTNTVTLVDPAVFTKPWGTTWHWKRHADWSLNEVFCVKSRDATVDGATVMLGPDGKPLLGPKQKKKTQ